MRYGYCRLWVTSHSFETYSDGSGEVGLADHHLEQYLIDDIEKSGGYSGHVMAFIVSSLCSCFLRFDQDHPLKWASIAHFGDMGPSPALVTCLSFAARASTDVGSWCICVPNVSCSLNCCVRWGSLMQWHLLLQILWIWLAVRRSFACGQLLANWMIEVPVYCFLACLIKHVYN